VVADALLASGHRVLGFTDANPALHGKKLLGLAVLGDDRAVQQYSPEQVVLANGIGITDNRQPSLRQRLHDCMRQQGFRFITVKHPSAIVASSVQTKDGIQIMAGSIVQAGVSLGEGCIINTGAIIEHHAQIGNWSHIAPGVIVCGEVSVGDFCHIGAGAVIRQQVTIGARCLIGTGAVVVKNADGPATFIGIPAKAFIKQS